MIGLSKTGVPGAGVVAVPLMAAVMPARESTGFLLPLLIAGDLAAIVYWCRIVAWIELLRLLPWTQAGVAAGYLGLRWIRSEELMPMIGALVLSLIGLTWWRRSKGGSGWSPPAPPGSLGPRA